MKVPARIETLIQPKEMTMAEDIARRYLDDMKNRLRAEEGITLRVYYEADYANKEKGEE
jgi:hypothetical protein